MMRKDNGYPEFECDSWWINKFASSLCPVRHDAKLRNVFFSKFPSNPSPACWLALLFPFPFSQRHSWFSDPVVFSTIFERWFHHFDESILPVKGQMASAFSSCLISEVSDTS
jgi:hypothetical protein